LFDFIIFFLDENKRCKKNIKKIIILDDLIRERIRFFNEEIVKNIIRICGFTERQTIKNCDEIIRNIQIKLKSEFFMYIYEIVRIHRHERTREAWEEQGGLPVPLNQEDIVGEWRFYAGTRLEEFCDLLIRHRLEREYDIEIVKSYYDSIIGELLDQITKKINNIEKTANITNTTIENDPRLQNLGEHLQLLHIIQEALNDFFLIFHEANIEGINLYNLNINNQFQQFLQNRVDNLPSLEQKLFYRIIYENGTYV